MYDDVPPPVLKKGKKSRKFASAPDVWAPVMLTNNPTPVTRTNEIPTNALNASSSPNQMMIRRPYLQAILPHHFVGHMPKSQEVEVLMH